MRRKMLPLLLLAILALTTAAFAQEPVSVDAEGNTFFWEETDGAQWDSAAPQAAAGALTPLGDPSGLRWDTERPGFVNWDLEGPFQNRYLFKIYLVGQSEPVWETTMHTGSWQDSAFSNDFFAAEANITPDENRGNQRMGSGDYYFTVQNLGDGITYSDGAVVSSQNLPGGIYHYVEPAAKLETPARGHWAWPASMWDDRSETDERIEHYWIDYGFAQEAGGTIGIIGGSGGGRSGMEDSWLQEKLIAENGAGWYYFRVRPISANIETWQNGEASPWSEGYNLRETAQKVVASLNAIDKSASQDEVRQQVQALDRADLKNALVADMNGIETGAEAAMRELETALGGPAQPQVTDADLAKVFDKDQVSIVGAALNNVTGTPALNIGAPKDPHDVRDELYNSTLAVDFSMDLSNVENPHDLAVPVKVTLPIPETINPDFLVILHYQADGFQEEVLHTTFQDGGRWYVSFLLTSFSDFTLTERGTQGSGPSVVIQPDGSYQAVRAPAGARLFLARYDGERMQSVVELPDLSGSLPGSGTLFLVDADFRPLCPCAEGGA